MAELSYRTATQTEAASIRTLIRRTRLNPLALDWRRFIVAVDAAGALAACGQVKPHADGSWELASIAVAEAFRGQGAARGIIERLLAAHPQRPLYLTCLAHLETFYVRFGFRVAAPTEMPPYYRRIHWLANTLFAWSSRRQVLLVMMKDGL